MVGVRERLLISYMILYDVQHVQYFHVATHNFLDKEGCLGRDDLCFGDSEK